MHTRRIGKWGIVLFLLLALPLVSAALAQGPQPAAKQLPVILQPGESTTTIPWTNTEGEIFDLAYQQNMVWGGIIESNGDEDRWEIIWDPSAEDEYEQIPMETHLPILIDIDADSFGSPVDTVICLTSDDNVNLGCNDESQGHDSTLYFVLESGRSYFLTVRDYWGEGGSNYKYQILVSSPLLISAVAGGLGTGYVDGIPFKAGDILAHSDFKVGGTTYQKWLLFFDLSDLDVKGNVTNITSGWRNSDYLLLSFQANVTLPGIAGTVRPWEVVRFDPSTIGPATGGTFSRWWNGGDNQLATTGEKLDAIEWPTWNGNTRLLVSTTGAAVVFGGASRPKLRMADEDIGLWTDDGRYWSLFLDGSKPYWTYYPTDIVAMSYNAYDRLDEGTYWYRYYLYYAVSQGNVTFPTVTATQKDILQYRTELSCEDECEAVEDGVNGLSLYWHGPDHGWNYNIDAIDFASKW